MSEKKRGTYQMLWDCPACGSEKLLGLSHKHCPVCGNPQDPSLRYYPSEDDKVAVEDHVFTGKDKICPNCDAPNGAKATFCGTCGAPLEGDAKEASTRGSQQAGGGGFEADNAAKARAEAKAAKAAAEGEKVQRMSGQGAPPPKANSGRWIGLLVLGLVVLSVVCCGFYSCYSTPLEVQVTGHRWERSIAVEERRSVKETAWCDEVPAAAQEIKKTGRDVRSQRKEPDGQSCTTVRQDQGDGTFVEKQNCTPKYKSVDVYDEKCSYQIEKWTEVDTVVASGANKTGSVSWPNVRLRMGQREGARRETYTVELKDADGKPHTCELELGRWQSFDVGQVLEAKASITGALKCDAL